MPLCVRAPSSVSLLCLYKPRLVEEGLLTSKSVFPWIPHSLCFVEWCVCFESLFCWPFLSAYPLCSFSLLFTPPCLLPPASLPLINQPLALSSSRLGCTLVFPVTPGGWHGPFGFAFIICWHLLLHFISSFSDLLKVISAHGGRGA